MMTIGPIRRMREIHLWSDRREGRVSIDTRPISKRRSGNHRLYFTLKLVAVAAGDGEPALTCRRFG